MRLLGKTGELKGMLGRKGAVGSKVGPSWKIDVQKGFLDKKRCLGRKWGFEGNRYSEWILDTKRAFGLKWGFQGKLS